MTRPSPAGIALLCIALTLLVLVDSIALGGPARPPPMASISEPFRSVDLSGLPTLAKFRGSDGTPLAYREYAATGVQKGSVTLIHGSSANSVSMHPLAHALATSGYRVFALDIRGHGQSGAKGHIDHVGQLDDDLAAFVREVRPPQPSTLAGFSSGGGFALRFAGGKYQALFSSYVLMSPFLSQDAPNQRPASGGWVSVGLPPVVALTMLNAAGFRAFNALPVTAFALDDRASALLTPTYDYNLATNFRPDPDFIANIRRAAAPCVVVAGMADEAFHTDRLEGIFRRAGKGWDVVLVPGVGHIALTLDARAIEAVVRAVDGLRE